MTKDLLSNIFKKYDIEENIINKNSIKCLLRAMNKKELSKIEGQYYIYDEETLSYLVDKYKKLNQFFNFFYSLKSDLISMFIYLIEAKENNKEIIFNAYFCPGYNDKGGYKNHLGKTSRTKLAILGDVAKFFTKEKIPFQIHCYYCDSYIENCDDAINKNWLKELNVNKELFIKEGTKYFDPKYIHCTSEMETFKNEKSYGGHIDNEIINRIPKKIYNSFYIANKVFYEKLNFTEEKTKERNDILATMYIKVSDYINSLPNGVYLPMENMYDREKIIANNNTCTMYLDQGLVNKYE